MTIVTPWRAALTLGRAGLADPFLGAAYARAVARWGLSLASVYHAAALRHPTRAAVIDDDGELTFSALERWTDAIAGGLAHPEGGQLTMGVLARNHRGFVAATIVAAKLGADAVYLNTGSAGPQLAEVLLREGVTHVVHDTEFSEVVAEATTVAGRAAKWTVITTDGESADSESADGARARARASMRSLATLAGERRPAPPRPSRTSMPILLTSGTTGTPKGARRGKPQFDLASATGLLSVVPFRTSDVFVVPAPLFHAWGLSQMVLAASLGSTLVTRRRFEPATVLADIREHHGTVLAAVPVMLQRILQHGDGAVDTVDTAGTAGAASSPRLRIVAVSGSALSAALATKWMDRFGDTLYNLYGSTEVGQATVAGPADLREAPGTAGRVLAGARVEILDGGGTPVPRGERGRIFVGSPNRFTGYTGGGTKAQLAGLLETGDIGHFDGRGRLFITGRQDDMIVSGGENVFPREVEDLLAELPAVADVAVVGVEDADLGQRLRAVVVRRPGARLTAKQVRDHVRRNLARHKVPRDVVFVSALPRNAAGKVLPKELR